MRTNMVSESFSNVHDQVKWGVVWNRDIFFQNLEVPKIDCEDIYSVYINMNELV